MPDLTRYPRIFALGTEVECVLPSQVGQKDAIGWRIRLMTSREFRLSIAIDRAAKAARDSGVLPSVAAIASDVDKQRANLCLHITGVVFPGGAWITESDQVSKVVDVMTPGPYTELESMVMGSSELTLLEKAS